MGKLIKIGDKSYRERRGKLVEIPEKWLGRITTNKTIRQRPSKVHRKLRKVVKNDGVTAEEHRYKELRRTPLDE